MLQPKKQVFFKKKMENRVLNKNHIWVHKLFNTKAISWILKFETIWITFYALHVLVYCPVPLETGDRETGDFLVKSLRILKII